MDFHCFRFLPDEKFFRYKLKVDTKDIYYRRKKGTWQVIDYILINERKWFLMEHEEYGPSCLCGSSDDGAVMNDNYNGLMQRQERRFKVSKTAGRERTGNIATETNINTNRTGTAATTEEKRTRAGKLAEDHGQRRISSQCGDGRRSQLQHDRRIDEQRPQVKDKDKPENLYLPSSDLTRRKSQSREETDAAESDDEDMERKKK